MKRISRIRIKNFKAYSNKTTIENPQLANMLIYGENGSGKTSLYKAITVFVNSSIDGAIELEKNEFVGSAEDGEIRITFKDTTDNSETEYVKSTNAGVTNVTGVKFLKDTAGIMGYLDYKQLLEFYLTDKSDPNLFDLIVIKLLGRYVIPGQGNSIREYWTEMNDNLFYVHTRATKKHKKGQRQMANLNTQLNALLPNLETLVNHYLSTYFPHMDLNIHLDFSGLSFYYGVNKRKADWQLRKSLKIEVKKAAGTPIHNYTTSLNEARLSAIALCIYLSALKQMPQVGIDFQLLILDDVFIGIDTGNRMPMLELLSNEFTDYQIIITTYDRSWYNMAREYFDTNHSNRWQMYEMYEGENNLPSGVKVSKPIITNGQSDFDHARRYLYDESVVDYPASANYFRKALENLLTKILPKGAVTTREKNPIESYKLTAIVLCAKTFFEQTQRIASEFYDCLSAITQIEGLLHHLIHPLSHFVPSIPVYKNELMTVEKAYEILKRNASYLQIRGKTKIERDKNTLVKFVISGHSGWIYGYEFKLLENIYSYDGKESLAKMRVSRMIEYDAAGNEKKSQRYKF